MLLATRSMDLYRGLGDRFHEAVALARLAGVHEAGGDAAAADAPRRQAVAIFDELGHPHADAVRAGRPV